MTAYKRGALSRKNTHIPRVNKIYLPGTPLIKNAIRCSYWYCFAEKLYWYCYYFPK